jgi:predicted nucleotidyltransferase
MSAALIMGALDRWDSSPFSSISPALSLYCSQTLFTPAHLPVTQTVGTQTLWHNARMLPHHQTFVDRFTATCQADARVVAALLIGSYATGLADSYSDLDLCVVTTDSAYEDFETKRKEFLGRLGDLVFLEDFDIPNIAFYIFADGVEGELYFRRESEIRNKPIFFASSRLCVMRSITLNPAEPGFGLLSSLRQSSQKVDDTRPLKLIRRGCMLNMQAARIIERRQSTLSAGKFQGVS